MIRSALSLAVLLAFALGACVGNQAFRPPSAEPGAPAASAIVPPVPAGYFTVTPGLIVDDIGQAIAFYEKAFGATTRFSVPGPDGKSVHAVIQIGNALLMLIPPSPHGPFKSPSSLGGTVGSLRIGVPDADATFATAVAAGGQVYIPLKDQFWGERWGQVVDPFGHKWGIGTDKVELTPDQIEQGAAVAFSPDREKAAAEIQRIWAAGKPSHQPLRAGWHSLTARLYLSNGNQTLDFYHQALGAIVYEKMLWPDGTLMNAEMKLGGSIINASDEHPDFDAQSPKTLNGTSMFLYIYVPDVDALAHQAKEAGATFHRPVTDRFWGDRVGIIRCPSGHLWLIASKKRYVSREELQKAMEK